MTTIFRKIIIIIIIIIIITIIIIIKIAQFWHFASISDVQTGTTLER